MCSWKATIESFMEFKRSAITKTPKALEENKKHDEDFDYCEVLEELDTTDYLTNEDRSYAINMQLIQTEKCL